MYEQNQKLQAVRSRCEASSKVINIIRIITVIGIIASIIGAVVCLTQRDLIDMNLAKAVEKGTVEVGNLRLGGGIFHLMIDYKQAFAAGNYAVPMFFNCIVSALVCLAVTMILSMFKNIFDRMIAEDNPFSNRNLMNFKTIFITITAVMVIFSGVGPGLAVGLLLWCIYSVFDYGKALQSEVDEIL